MRRPHAEGDAQTSRRKFVGRSVSTLLIAGSVVVAVLGPPDHVNTLTVVLGIGAVVAGFIIEDAPGGPPVVSGSFIVFALAATFLGPGSAAIAATISEFCASVKQRTNYRSRVHQPSRRDRPSRRRGNRYQSPVRRAGEYGWFLRRRRTGDDRRLRHELRPLRGVAAAQPTRGGAGIRSRFLSSRCRVRR